MKINYVVDERIEFFSSLLTVNDYWNLLAKKFWNKEMMAHPYKEDVINYFLEFKDHEAFSLLKQLCSGLHDFSILLEIPFFFTVKNEDCGQRLPMPDVIKENVFFVKTISLMKDLYQKSHYDTFFSKLDKRSFYLSDEHKNKISETLNNLQAYIKVPFDSIDIFICPLILGNYLIPLFSSEVSIAISPYDYKDKYIWGKPEDYILSFVIQNISSTVISSIKERLNSQKDKFPCNIPYYNTVESVISNMLSRMILIRLKTLFYNEQEENLLEKEIQNFPKIGLYYNRLVENESDCKFSTASVDKIFSL